MTLIRVRLCIDRGPCFKAEQCWMLVETSSCKFIHDFEYLIRKKFFMDDGHNVILNLYLDDFLLPSQEKIAVIRDNDVIRVKEDKVLAFNDGDFLTSNNENKNKNPKKRKFDESSDMKKKRKKMKHSPTNNKEEQDMVSVKQLKTQSQIPSTKTSLKTFNKAKCQKAMNFLQKVTNDNTKKVSGDEFSASGNCCQRKRVKHKNKSLKKKFKSSALNCILEKWNSASNNKQSTSEQVGNVALEKGAKEGLHSVAKPFRFEKGGKESNKPTVEDVQKTNNAISGSKKVFDDIKRKEETVKEKKKPLLIQSSQKSSMSPSSATSTNSSSTDGESNVNIVKKNAFNGQTVNKRNEPQEGAKIPQTSGQDVNEDELYKQNQRHNGFPSKQSTSNHIRFDQSSEHVERAAEMAPLPGCPNALPACSTSMDNNAINGTPNLSPIQQNNNVKHTTPSDNAQKLLKTATENKWKGRCRNNNLKKDVYSYKSVVMESTRMEKESEDVLCPIPTDVPQKDFSKYQPLVGPPRVGETVAYKILELSQSYTPEISQYKVGKVLSFDPASKSMNLKLTKESLTRATGDGRVSFKFELFDGDEEEGGDEEENLSVLVEIPDEVEVQWSSMIDPRLIVAGIV